jgi:hypothetical protein
LGPGFDLWCNQTWQKKYKNSLNPRARLFKALLSLRPCVFDSMFRVPLAHRFWPLS